MISPEEPERDEPTWVPIDKAQYLRTGTERGSNHQTSDGQIQLTTPQFRRQRLIPGLLQTNEDVQ